MRHVTHLQYLTIASLLFSLQLSAAAVDDQTQWQPYGSSHALEDEVARHETGSVAVGTDIYLLGGRRNRPTLKFDSTSDTWSSLGLIPESAESSDSIELHHFQPVAIGTDIYVLGAMFGGGFPEELSDTNVRVLDTLTDEWSIVDQMPTGRERGSAGVVVRDGIIYLVGGNTNGHNGGAVAWFDSYNPVTQQWQVLADAPNARDHFAAAIVDNKLVATGGRQSSTSNGNQVFDNTVADTDVYDFATGLWSSGVDIPTQRAGTVVASAGQEVLVAGGESPASEFALSTVEAYDVNSNSWRALQSMNTARHSGGSAVIGTSWHVFSGSVTRGGGVDNETSSHETLDLDVPPDSDNDGLSDADEIDIYETDPADADSDDDDLFDGPEVHDYQTDPSSSDSDEDNVPDGEEVITWGSDPNDADTDSDQLDDGEEVNQWLTSPTDTDTDEDELDDYAEVIAGTDPLDEDTDDDGLLDGEDPSPLVDETATNNNNSGGSLAWVLLVLLGFMRVIRSNIVSS